MDRNVSVTDAQNATRIRDLFLHRRPTYSPAEAAEMLDMSMDAVWGSAAVGELEADENDNIPWAELVSFAMEFCEQSDLEAALGAELAEAVPELLRLADLKVRIPRIEVLALERIAVRDGRSVDAVLARELRDLLSAESHWLAEEIDGFAAALRWPEGG
jgi:hypothetical protein